MMVTLDNYKVDFDACAILMDDNICEELNWEMAPCSEQEFLDAYVQRHAKKFNGEVFTI